MLLRRIRPHNILSFGPDTQELELKPLNILIGPNGSGKSNFLEIIRLLHAAPTEFTAPIREGGGVADWVWKGKPRASSAGMEVIFNNAYSQPLRYDISFAENGQRFELIHEKLANEQSLPGHDNPYIYFDLSGGKAVLNYKDTESNGKNRKLKPEEVDTANSILAQYKDSYHYPELTYLGKELSKIRMYREWSFGRATPPRLPQKPDLPNDFLEEDGRNLGLVLNRLMGDFEVKQQIINALRDLYEGISDFHVNIDFGTVQVFLHEGNITVPATRLSDGTLRYLCLLAILCHPSPPPLVCLEEPELGLHPDIIPGLGELLRDASQRCQLIVTTHSVSLVDTFTDTPECIVTCEKNNGQTTLRRLGKEELSHWLENYRLGELWSSGELGGNRW